MGKTVSFAPAKQHKGGSMFDDFDGEIVGAVATTMDYTDKSGKVVAAGVVVMSLSLKPLVEGSTPFDENYGVGGKLKPTEDGKSFEGISDDDDADGLADNSQTGLFMDKLKAAGFPESKFGDTLEFLVGVKGHFRRIDPPASSTSKRKILVVTRVLDGGTAAAAGAKAADAGEATKKAIEFVKAALAKKGSEIAKAKLGQAANKFFEKDAAKGDIVRLLLDEKFLKTLPELGIAAYNGREIAPLPAASTAAAAPAEDPMAGL